MKKSYFIAILILVVSVIWIGSGVIIPNDPENPQENDALVEQEGETRAKVRVIDSVAQNYKRVIKVNGRSRASKNVTLRAEASGQVLEIIANEGDPIEKGAEIIKIDIRERKERVREASELVKQKQIEFNAAQKLIKQGYSSNVRVAQTRSELESARAAFTRAEIDLEKTTIIAPFDGVLGVRHVDIGDYVSVSDPITSIVDLDPLEVTAFVNEKEVLQIKKGNMAQLKFLNGEAVMGEITFISPAADEESRTFQVDVSLDNAGNKRLAGLTAEVSIEVGAEKAHKISPAILTLNDAGDVGVKLVTIENKIQFTPVKILADAPGHMWISGLPDAAKIVSAGQDFVIDGQLVDAVSVEP
ncbi:MAG: hypothetical protein COB76_07210 [Alphaproteobacteria bacterium]|nr:MAG: hypothetical protein COB76_07210 [Alphaproteobacteria bacterium]